MNTPEFLEHYLSADRVHVKSMISTLFGDLVNCHGGKIWVETITALLEPLGVNNRLVRTSLFRLSEEQWLTSTRAGRKSYYTLTTAAQSQTELAEKLIYSASQHSWDGSWTLVFIVIEPIDVQARRQLEQELAWVGFGAVAKHIFAHPTASEQLVAERVRSLGLEKNVICLRANNLYDKVPGLEVDDRKMAAKCFPMPDLASQYAKFIETFSKLDLKKMVLGDQTELVSLRLLLIDEYRRIVLHDPHLPSKLLPADWEGEQAYTLCKNVYQVLWQPTQATYRRLLASAGDDLLTDSVQNKPRFR